MTSKVKDQGRKVTWSVWAVLSQCYTCVIRGRRGHIVSAEPGGHTFQDNMGALAYWLDVAHLRFNTLDAA